MSLNPEQQEIFNSMLDLVYSLKTERDQDKKIEIQYLIEEKKGSLMNTMPFRDYIKFMVKASPLFL
jgi:hypothetical protein